MALEQQLRAAQRSLEGVDFLIVALSGGVDSAVLLGLALRTLGPQRILAITGQSSSLSERDRQAAVSVAVAAGVRHRFLETQEATLPAYRANGPDRCYHCRQELFSRLSEEAKAHAGARIAYGAIADDLGDHRPGMRAAERWGILAPLLDAGLDKRAVRELAHRWQIPVADAPTGACLASRIPTGTEVTADRMRQVEMAESKLKELGLSQLRVRYRGLAARVELDATGLRLAAEAAGRQRIEQAVAEAGFQEVVIDPRGYRTGGGNSAIGEVVQALERTRADGPDPGRGPVAEDDSSSH
jgi:uncharacterized protein